MFTISKEFADEDFKICNLKLSRLILNNNSLFPWVILVPMRANVQEIIDLNKEDQHLLMDEISLVSKVMQNLFNPDKLNVAALGNIVPQLHIHIVSRYKNDKAWPQPVFVKESNPYNEETRLETIRRIFTAIHNEVYHG